VALSSKEEAKRWVVNNQLGKRNLSDTEMQRLRAEQAKLSGTKLVAESHHVNQRTVQRDVEADKALELMGEDVRERVKTGAIVSNRKNLLDYGKLTDEQRGATDQALRNNKGLTLQQALPKKAAGAPSPEDFTSLNDNPHISSKNKRSIACETIHATGKAIQQLGKLKPEQQVIVNELLNDPQIESLDDAIKTFRQGMSPIKPGDKAAKTKAKLKKLLGDVLRSLDDLNNLEASTLHKQAIAKTKEVLTLVDEW